MLMGRTGCSQVVPRALEGAVYLEGRGRLGFWVLSLWSRGFAEDEASQSWALSVGAVQGSSVTPLPSCRPELKPVDKESEVMMK